MNKIKYITIAGIALSVIGMTTASLAATNCGDDLSQATASCLNNNEMTTFAQNYQKYLGTSDPAPAVSAPAPQPNQLNQSSPDPQQKSPSTNNNTSNQKSTIHWY
jgi:hypothetical protein